MKRRKRKGVVLGSGFCDGCGKCVEACLKEDRKRGGRGRAAIRVVKGQASCVPVVCRTCEEAPCVTACMTGCRKRDEGGRVVTDYGRCVGCWMCVMSCPFGAIERVAEEHVAWKCEGCTGNGPAPCVAACRLGVLTHGDAREIADDRRREAAVRFLAGERAGPG